MHVLVTGGTGFVGRHLCRELDARGHDVTAMSRTPGDVELPTGVARVSGDVTDPESLDGAFAGMDAVVHLVALTPLYKPKGGESRHEVVIFGGTQNVIQAAEANGVDRLVYQSALRMDPTSSWSYSRSKGRAEEAVRASSLDWVIVRPSIIFGEGEEFTPFVSLLTTPYVTVLPGGGRTMKFQPIWIEDFIPILADCVEREEHIGRAYDIAGPEQLSLADVTRALYRSKGRAVTIIPMPIALARLGIAAVDIVPLIPFGRGQGKALRYENITDENAVETFGIDPDALTTYESYLARR